MNKIKFSHLYTKMIDGDEFLYHQQITLLQVFKTHYKELSQSFIDYDTQIYGTQEYYPLPKTEVLVLLLRLSNGHVFTTVRRYTPQKEVYYRGLQGKEIQCLISK